MAAKYQLITELYRRTGRDVTRNPQAWQGFLSSACRNYKCRFDEQLLIYAQRPDATAVAEIGTWNRLFKRWVNKDSKGIAVFDPKGRRNTLKYYFDVSDTHEGYYGSRPVPIWQMDKRYEQPVMERLADRFGGTEGGDLATFLMGTAENAVEDNLPDYLSQLKDCTKDSFLEELDDFNIEVIYKRLAANSVAYMLLSRCGLDADGYFEREDFVDITNFNTPATLNAIGIATSDISEMALREISAAVRNVQIEARGQNRTFAKNMASQYDKGRKQPERSEYNERNHLHETGGLSYTRPDITDRARASAWQVRFDAQGLSGKSQEGDVPQPADVGQAERTPLPDRADGSFQTGTTDEAARSRAGRDGGAERESTDAVGTGNERHPQPSGGSDTGRTDLQLEPEQQTESAKGSVANEEEVAANLPTIDEQIEMIAEAEDEKASAFAVSQEDIDAILVKGSGYANGKYHIYHQFQKQEDKKNNIEFLKKEYGTGGFFVDFSDGTEGYVWYSGKGIAIDRDGISTEHDLVLSWAKIEKRLRELIQDNRYLNPKEKDHYPDYLESISAPQYEIDTQRKLKRQRFIEEKGELPPADKRDTLALRLSDFIRDLDGYEKALLENIGRTDFADVTEGQMEQSFSDPATVQQLLDFLKLVQGQTTSVYSRSNAWRFSQELTELYPLRYLYHEGDVVYIGADKYEVIAFDENAVSLRNAEFPLFGKEFSRDNFEEKLRENPANDHLKTVITESQKTETPAEKKPDSITFSIGFSEHPAFYDRKLNDRFTELSFALGNRLLGVLDEKQHYERLDESKGVGWYKKTDFEIHAVIGGEDFNYEGRFDIGDGEGDLIAHIRNFYEYSLSPDCPFIPEWKRQGEDYYRERIESLRFGQDVFLPFLEQHTELTPEDEKLLAEILATESDWNRKGGDKEQPEETEAAEEQVAREREDELPEERFEVTMTSDAFPDPEDAFAIWDNRREDYYIEWDGTVLTYPTEEEAQKGLSEGRKAAADKETTSPVIARYLSGDEAVVIMQYPNGKYYNRYGYDGQRGIANTTAGGFDTFDEAEKALYSHRPKAEKAVEPMQSQDRGLPPAQDSSDLIGKEFMIDNRRYLIESVGKISSDVSMRDITFQNSVGFPINRVEKIGYVRRLLEQEQKEAQTEEKAESPVKPTTETVAEYPAVENGLPYDVVVEKIKFGEPERKPQGRDLKDILHTRLENAKGGAGYAALKEDIDTLFMDKDGDSLVGIASDEWLKQLADMPDDEFREYTDNYQKGRLNAYKLLPHSTERRNYRITDDTLGVGGAKEKFRNNLSAIRLLHDLQIENRPATPEEQETLAK